MWTCVKYIDRYVGKLHHWPNQEDAKTKQGRQTGKNADRQTDKQTGKDRQALDTWRKLADRKDTGPQSLVCVNARITEKKEKLEPQGQTVCKPPTLHSFRLSFSTRAGDTEWGLKHQVSNCTAAVKAAQRSHCFWQWAIMSEVIVLCCQQMLPEGFTRTSGMSVLIYRCVFVHFCVCSLCLCVSWGKRFVGVL